MINVDTGIAQDFSNNRYGIGGRHVARAWMVGSGNLIISNQPTHTERINTTSSPRDLFKTTGVPYQGTRLLGALEEKS